MKPTQDMAERFLAQPHIAVVGVSAGRESPANHIFRKLAKAGRTVYPVNPHLSEFDGERCFPDVESIDAPVEGVIIVTRPEITDRVAESCIRRGVPHVWMHSMLGTNVKVGRSITNKTTSVSEDAVRRLQEAGAEVIAGSCPMQWMEPVDFAHRCIRGFARAAGNLAVS